MEYLFMQKQVSKAHYEFTNYMTKRRWASFWHQLDEVLKLAPENVLEIGPGPGLFKVIAATFNVKVETLDIDKDLNPDYIASVFALPFESNSFDVICAFQMLEHLPFEDSVRAMSEMCRVAKKAVILSLPDAGGHWPFILGLPGGKEIAHPIPTPRFWALPNHFDGEHYWELNKQGYPLAKVIESFSQFGFKLEKTYLVDRNPYHRFLVFKPSIG
jgi:SAM-dependent methyltransferase